MFALPCIKVIIRRGGIELNPNAQLLPVPRARRYREPEAVPAVAKARMERVNAGELPYALPYALPKAGDQNAIHQILAGPPAPKRSNAANPLPEPATAEPATEELSKAGAALPPPTISPFLDLLTSIVIANVPAMAQSAAPPAVAVPGGDANGYIANFLAMAPSAAPPAAAFPGAPRPLPPALYEDLRRRARALDDWNEGLAEPRTYNPHPISY